jgi:hypothetical protein
MKKNHEQYKKDYYLPRERDNMIYGLESFATMIGNIRKDDYGSNTYLVEIENLLRDGLYTTNQMTHVKRDDIQKKILYPLKKLYLHSLAP